MQEGIRSQRMCTKRAQWRAFTGDLQVCLPRFHYARDFGGQLIRRQPFDLLSILEPANFVDLSCIYLLQRPGSAFQSKESEDKLTRDTARA